MAVWRGVRAYEAAPEITEWTVGRDAYEAMHVLEGRRCTSRVCQDARDRCDVDPQLAHLNWLTDVTGTKIGRWPVANVPSKLSATPAHIGGILDRAHPVMGRTTSGCWASSWGSVPEKSPSSRPTGSSRDASVRCSFGDRL